MGNPLTDIDFEHYTALASKAIDALPFDVPSLRDFLGAQGVMAQCGHPERCAIAQYVQESAPLPEGYRWTVDGREVRITTNYYNSNCTPAQARDFRSQASANAIPLNSAQNEFIRKFDQGFYPELIELNGTLDLDMAMKETP